MSKQLSFANHMHINTYYAIDTFFVETSEPLPDGSEYPVPDGKQQVFVDSAPSTEVESPGVASTGDIYYMYIHVTVFLSLVA